MQKIEYFCDTCAKECFVQDGLGTFAGFIVKIDGELKPQRIGFEGHYCAVCAEKVLKFISELKNAKYTNSTGVGEQIEQGTADSGA